MFDRYLQPNELKLFLGVSNSTPGIVWTALHLEKSHVLIFQEFSADFTKTYGNFFLHVPWPTLPAISLKCSLWINRWIVAQISSKVFVCYNAPLNWRISHSFLPWVAFLFPVCLFGDITEDSPGVPFPRHCVLNFLDIGFHCCNMACSSVSFVRCLGALLSWSRAFPLAPVSHKM